MALTATLKFMLLGPNLTSSSIHFFGFSNNLFKFHFRISRPRSTFAVRATSLDFKEEKDHLNFSLFSCPICYEPLLRKGPGGLSLSDIYRSGFKCVKCDKTFTSKDNYLDLTVSSGTRDYNESNSIGTELFRSPLVSYLYERGWRQRFNRSGFPGPDEEFKMAQEHFKPVEGGFLVDVSCGSGLFSRKFAKSGIYSGVIALDFSENMLRQCFEFVKKDDSMEETNFALVRADVSKLPFLSSSVDAVHAGAAMHCWPSPSNAVAEISRVLRSGGIFVGTTFLHLRTSPLNSGMLGYLRQVSNAPIYLTEKEIKLLIESCGFTNYRTKIQQSFIMFSAQKR